MPNYQTIPIPEVVDSENENKEIVEAFDQILMKSK